MLPRDICHQSEHVGLQGLELLVLYPHVIHGLILFSVTPLIEVPCILTNLYLLLCLSQIGNKGALKFVIPDCERHFWVSPLSVRWT